MANNISNSGLGPNVVKWHHQNRAITVHLEMYANIFFCLFHEQVSDMLFAMKKVPMIIATSEQFGVLRAPIIFSKNLCRISKAAY